MVPMKTGGQVLSAAELESLSGGVHGEHGLIAFVTNNH